MNSTAGYFVPGFTCWYGEYAYSHLNGSGSFADPYSDTQNCASMNCRYTGGESA